jgi:dTDP-D-glucose 4,6-dehydratase
VLSVISSRCISTGLVAQPFWVGPAGSRFAVCNRSQQDRPTLGFAAAHDVALWLESTVNWYLHNEQWWRDVLSGDYRNDK